VDERARERFHLTRHRFSGHRFGNGVGGLVGRGLSLRRSMLLTAAAGGPAHFRRDPRQCLLKVLHRERCEESSDEPGTDISRDVRVA